MAAVAVIQAYRVVRAKAAAVRAVAVQAAVAKGLVEAVAVAMAMAAATAEPVRPHIGCSAHWLRRTCSQCSMWLGR
jgi:hypothetical protein